MARTPHPYTGRSNVGDGVCGFVSAPPSTTPSASSSSMPSRCRRSSSAWPSSGRPGQAEDVDDEWKLRLERVRHPAVWRASTTTNAERKKLRRLVVREVTVSPIDMPQRLTRVQVQWPTGAVSDFTVPRKDKYTAQATSEQALSLIGDLHLNEKKDDWEIAIPLNRRGQDRSWDLGGGSPSPCADGIVRASRKARRPPDQRGDKLYSVHTRGRS
jgi:hypothetical protein